MSAEAAGAGGAARQLKAADNVGGTGCDRLITKTRSRVSSAQLGNMPPIMVRVLSGAQGPTTEAPNVRSLGTDVSSTRSRAYEPELTESFSD
jgi:hypothetical protein